MILRWNPEEITGLSFPRRCGGDPVPASRKKFYRAVFPAGAGVILGENCQLLEENGFPRRCGGDPNVSNSDVCGLEFSPQVRG